MFSKLDQEFAPGIVFAFCSITLTYIVDYSYILLFFILAVKKLEVSVLKFYVINALTNNKIDKVSEFLLKMINEIHGQIEWRDWYGKYDPSRTE